MLRITKAMLAVAGAAAFVATPILAKPHAGHGTDILHFSIRENFQNPGVEAGASGAVQAGQNEQGNANNQKLDILLKGLNASTTYSLFALTGDNSNATFVANFTTDGSGSSAMHYRSVGNGHGGGKGKTALPDSLNPISNIRQLSVADTNTATVLTADFTSPDKLQYLVQRDISNTTGVSAGLRIKATTNQTQFKLTASGLAGTTDYLLAINDAVVQTNTSDMGGNLTITTQQSGLDVLDIHSVALWDTASNVVVSTTLP